MQNAELLYISASSREGLQHQVRRLLAFSARLSRAELTDLAAHLAERGASNPVRAAVVASSPAELSTNLGTLQAWLSQGAESRLDIRAGVMLSLNSRPPAIGFLFPGQGSPANLTGGVWARRFRPVRERYRRTHLPVHRDGTASEVAQPAIVIASEAGWRTLDQIGIRASIAIGHSLGELSAYHWAGANVPQSLSSLSRDSFLRTLGPKVQRARNVLRAADPAARRLLVTFGSIIARTGMHGQAEQGCSMSQTARTVRHIESLLAEEDQVLSTSAFIGRNGPLVFYNLTSQETYANHFAQLIVRTEHWRQTAKVAEALQVRLNAEVVGTECCVHILEHGAPFIAPFEVRISGPSAEILQQLGRRAQTVLQQTPGVRNVRSNYGEEALSTLR